MGSELSRRSFLKAIGVTSAGIVLPSFDILMPKEVVEPRFRMRPVVIYDIYGDLEIVRYDVYDGKTQLYVAGMVDEETCNNRKLFIKKVHKPMVAAMKNNLFKARIPPSRLKPLKMPPGYKHPEWFKEILNG